jgi:hypothetical protein
VGGVSSASATTFFLSVALVIVGFEISQPQPWHLNPMRKLVVPSDAIAGPGIE